MNTHDKLRVILPHWIEHTANHGAEFSTWADNMRKEHPDIALLLDRAGKALEEAEKTLAEALHKAGGPLESGHHHGHHHHHH